MRSTLHPSSRHGENGSFFFSAQPNSYKASHIFSQAKRLHLILNLILGPSRLLNLVYLAWPEISPQEKVHRIRRIIFEVKQVN